MQWGIIDGWGIISKVGKSPADCNKNEGICYKAVLDEMHEDFSLSTKVKEVINPRKTIQVLESDFVESSSNKKPYSVEDRRFLTILENGIKKRTDSHYEIPQLTLTLTSRSDCLSLPDNCQLAFKRWNQLEDYQGSFQPFLSNFPLLRGTALSAGCEQSQGWLTTLHFQKSQSKVT